MYYNDFHGNKISLLGMGCMRYPLDQNGEVDTKEAIRVIRKAIDSGITYVDTAYMYHNGYSERVLGMALADGYREKVLIADKMPPWMAKDRSDLEKIFEKQLARLGVDCIDIYLIHSLDKENWQIAKDLDVLGFMEEKKAEGKIRYIGFSFHDDCDLFEEILSSYPWDMCQIQLNYVDKEHQAGLRGLELAVSKDIPVTIMEPLKGGRLSRKLPPSTDRLWDEMSEKRPPVDWAFSWVADRKGILTVLSGMSSMEQLDHNIELFSGLAPGNMKQQDIDVLSDIADAFRSAVEYGCTGCSYCMPCPQGIDIPQAIGFYNDVGVYDRAPAIYESYGWMDHLASECIGCRQCEAACPQHLPVSEIMKKAALELEGKEI